MGTNRLEAFSDGVIAIIITIMVLELKAPHDTSLHELIKLSPVFLSYMLSFLVVAIMWVNHHHLLHTAMKVDGSLLWANNNLLFWMSLIPFVTAFLGENPKAPLAVAIYGVVLTAAATSFTLLRYVVSQHHLDDVDMSAHNRRIQRKNALSNLLYASSIPLAFLSIYLSFFIFVFIPVLYFMPERKLAEHKL
jgi:uncharacterized membrane protein